MSVTLQIADQDFTRDISGLQSLKITYDLEQLTAGKAPAVTGEIEITGNAYDYVKANLIDTCNRSKRLECLLEDKACGISLPLQIKARGITWNEDYCTMTLNLVDNNKDTRVIRALREKLAFDNEYWRGVEKPLVRTDYELGPGRGDFELFSKPTYCPSTYLRDYFLGAVGHANSAISEFDVTFSSNIINNDQSPYYRCVYATSVTIQHPTWEDVNFGFISPNHKDYRYGRDIYAFSQELKNVFNSYFIPVKNDDGTVTCHFERRDFFDGLQGKWFDYLRARDEDITWETIDDVDNAYMTFEYIESDDVSNEAIGLGFDNNDGTWTDDYGISQPVLPYARYTGIVKFKESEDIDLTEDSDDNPDRTGALEITPPFEAVKVRADLVGGILQLGNAPYSKIKKYTLDEAPGFSPNVSRARRGELQTTSAAFGQKLVIVKDEDFVGGDYALGITGRPPYRLTKVKSRYAVAALDDLPSSGNRPVPDDTYRHNYPLWFNPYVQADSTRFADYSAGLIEFDDENNLHQNFWWIENPNAGRLYCHRFRFQTPLTSGLFSTFDLLKYVQLPPDSNGNERVGFMRRVEFDLGKRTILVEGVC